MMRALWTASSGMIGQQTNVDVISNNLANVNTTAYKKEKVEFKDLLYDTMQRAYVLDDNSGRPVNLQVGLGSTPVATVKDFSTGNLEKTDNPLDVAIDGEGFLVVLGPRNEIVYTRDGNLKLSLTDQGRRLSTSDGYAILDDAGQEIYLDVSADKLVISPEGDLGYIDADNITQPLGQRIALVTFPNKAGLESIGGNFYRYTSASGEPVLNGEDGSAPSTLRQYFLESSNVQVVEEMVKLIVAQRAYEINSKSIQTADEMLGMANNLKR